MTLPGKESYWNLEECGMVNPRQVWGHPRKLLIQIASVCSRPSFCLFHPLPTLGAALCRQHPHAPSPWLLVGFRSRETGQEERDGNQDSCSPTAQPQNFSGMSDSPRASLLLSLFIMTGFQASYRAGWLADKVPLKISAS